jgi:RNA-directed DNA polymerase
VRNNVSDLQFKLYHAAKQSLDRKFGALYDKIYREDVMFEAWKRVKANKGVPGYDKQDFEYIENEIGIDQFLGDICTELKEYRYQPQPVLRCYIEKPGKLEKRPLGIPVIKDRTVQMMCKLIIEPIFETNFLDCSHGFRPKRRAHQAIDIIRRKITFEYQTIVIDADIKGYFNNIRHDILMKLVEKRISDPHMLKLIRSWLEAGVMEGGKYYESDGLCTPQGGVISPLLANIYLHSFDKMFQLSGIPGTLVRYCDDFVILLRRNGKLVLDQIKQMLDKLGLELHPDKTKVVHAEEGFDFLGIHFRLQPVRKKGSRLKYSCRLWPADSSISRAKQRIKEVIGKKYNKSLEEIIADLNPVIRGWMNYQRVPFSEPKRRRKLNWFVRERLRIFLRRKYSDQVRGGKRLLENLPVRLGLYQYS